MPSDDDQRVRSKHSYSFANGWHFDPHVLDECAHLYIPSVGWGGGGGAASPQQDAWVVAQLEPLEGVRGSWMACWTMSLELLPTVRKLLERGVEPPPAPSAS